MWFLIFFFFTPWAQGLLHATQVSYLVISPDLFVFFPLGRDLGVGVLLNCPVSSCSGAVLPQALTSLGSQAPIVTEPGHSVWIVKGVELVLLCAY